MKKIKYWLLLLILIPISVNASETYYIAMEKDGEVSYLEYNFKKLNHSYYFKISPFEEYTINDPVYLNNLAYLSSFNEMPDYETTIQLMIWQNTHPDYNFYIVDSNYQTFDNSINEDQIQIRLEVLKQNVEFKDDIIMLNPNEELILTTTVNLNNYQIDSNIQIDNYTIRLQYPDKGIRNINFRALDPNIVGDEIYGTKFYQEPFTLTIDVDNYQDINITTSLDNELIPSNIQVYDQDKNLVTELNDLNNTIRLKHQKYTFRDMVTKEEITTFINSDIKEISFGHHLINGIKTNMDINKICQDDTCFNFTKQDDIYILDTPILNGYYEINDLAYNLNIEDNYYLDEKKGLLYIIEYMEEEEEIIPTPDEETDDNDEEIIIPSEEETTEEETIIPPVEIKDEISIDIPDTGIEINFPSNYYYAVKKENE